MYIEQAPRRRQTLEDEPDGSLILTLRINHTLEIKRLALSWGADCEVLEPVELRDEIVQELARIAEAYGNRRNCRERFNVGICRTSCPRREEMGVPGDGTHVPSLARGADEYADAR